MASSAEAVREDVRFTSAGEQLAGWLYRPTGGDGGACVILAHGFGALKEGRLDAYAERFAAAGYTALVFDYRRFGESGGQPRQLVSVKEQHEDWRAAIAFARVQDGVDPNGIAIWGSSFSGGHVIVLAAKDDRIAAVIAQTPFASGLATLRELRPLQALGLTGIGIADQAGALLGREPRLIPTVGAPGALAAMTNDDALDGYARMYPPGFDFGNGVAARIMLAVPMYRPWRHAAKVGCPLLVQVGSNDHITPPGPARKAAARAPRGELLEYPISHFEVYVGDAFERSVSDQTEFLRRHLPS